MYVDISRFFDSIHRGNMRQILLAYVHSKETDKCIMMIYKKNRKAKALSPDVRHCRWGLARRYIIAIFVYTVP